MHIAVLSVISAMPILFVCHDLMRKYRALELLKNFNRLFEQIGFILKSSPVEIKILFSVMANRKILPSFCKRISDELQNDAAFTDAWNVAFAETNSADLSVGECKQILSFSDSFGLGNVEDQLRLCSFFSQYCSESVLKRQKELEKNSKFYLTGSFLFGAFLFVVFI